MKDINKNKQRKIALYVHVPFCLRKCFYCDFYSIPVKGQNLETFVVAVEIELKRYLNYMYKENKELPKLTSLYIGGGTPTCLPQSLLLRLIKGCLKEFGVKTDHSDEIEVTLEVNPETINLVRLIELRQVGVNRLSIGIQSLNPVLLQKMGRLHTVEDSFRTLKWARLAGFENINLDLIFGLPEQSLNDWKEDLQKVLTLKPEHLSAYNLKVEPGTLFYRLRQKKKLNLPEEDEQACMYEELIRQMKEAGYLHYELSNFCYPGYESRHNLVYWTNEEYLGLGPAAHSCLWSIFPAEVWGKYPNIDSNNFVESRPVRWSNLSDLKKYIYYLQSGQSPVNFTEVISPEIERAETVFLGLRLLKGINRQSFAERFGITIEEAFPGVVESLFKRGLLQEKGGYISLKSGVEFISNEVFQEFI